MDCTTLSAIIANDTYISCLMYTINETTIRVLDTGLTEFSQAYLRPLTIITSLSLVLIGYAMMTGKSDNRTGKEIVFSMLSVFIVYVFATNFTQPMPYGGGTNSPFSITHSLLTEAPAELANYMLPPDKKNTDTSQVKDTTYQTLDIMTASILKNGWELIQQPGKSFVSGNFSFALAVCGLVIMVAGALYIGVTTGLLIVNHIRVSFLLLLSPLFISFLMFEKTRNMTQHWIQNLIAAALTALFIYAVSMIIYIISDMYISELAVITQEINNPTDSLSIMQVLPGIIVLIAALILITDVPSIARDIAGGIGGSQGLMSPTAMAGTVGGMAGGAVGAGGAFALRQLSKLRNVNKIKGITG